MLHAIQYGFVHSDASSVTHPARRLLPFIVVSAVLAIAGAMLGDGWLLLHQVAKPLTTMLILLAAGQAVPALSPRYRLLVLIGLSLSLVGDVLLMPPWHLFVPGLIAFLVAHLFFIPAFAPGASNRSRIIALLIYSAIAVINLNFLLPKVPDDLKLPVTAYVVVLVLMASLAGARAWTCRHDVRLRDSARWAGIGGALFVVSDSLLAWNLFGGGLPMSSLLVLSSYFAAVWCIARSVQRH